MILLLSLSSFLSNDTLLALLCLFLFFFLSIVGIFRAMISLYRQDSLYGNRSTAKCIRLLPASSSGLCPTGALTHPCILSLPLFFLLVSSKVYILTFKVHNILCSNITAFSSWYSSILTTSISLFSFSQVIPCSSLLFANFLYSLCCCLSFAYLHWKFAPFGLSAASKISRYDFKLRYIFSVYDTLRLVCRHTNQYSDSYIFMPYT